MHYIVLIMGFILLIKGADFFVEGSSSVAKLLRVPSVIIGLTIVAFGTSAPELAVSVTAAIEGNNEIAMGNVIGSNIFNLMVVTGVCGAISPMAVDKKILYGDYLYSIFISVVLLTMVAFDHYVSRLDALILLALFSYFLYSTVKSALNTRISIEEQPQSLPPFRSGVYIVFGIIAIVAGGKIVVWSATNIAVAAGLSQTLIGLTIVAVGTSLPELVTSIVAAGKGENGLAFGNVIGSNIFNILAVLAASAAISPMDVNIASAYDLICLIVFSLVIWLFSRTGFKIDRREGAIMVSMYLVYMIYITVR